MTNREATLASYLSPPGRYSPCASGARGVRGGVYQRKRPRDLSGARGRSVSNIRVSLARYGLALRTSPLSIFLLASYCPVLLSAPGLLINDLHSSTHTMREFR